MRVRFLIAIVFGVVLTHSVQGQNTSDKPKRLGFSASTTFHYNGNTYTYDYATTDLSDTPSWDPATSEPPLSMRRAVEVGQTALQRFVKSGDVWQITSIAANEMETDKWM